MLPHKRLGEIFVEHGILSQKTADRILERSQALQRRFGEVLEDMELITGDELAAALAIQYNCKVVKNLAGIAISPNVLQLVPIAVAMENLILPLGVENGRLAIAMADPTLSKVTDNLAADNGLKVVPFTASKRDILAGICRHYIGREPNSPTQHTLLVVEDDKLVLTMLKDVLAGAGYHVLTAGDGMEAFKAVIAEKPHVIITDKELPKLDGYALFDALAKVPETRFIPVILVTGTAMNPEEEAKAFDKGFFDFIVKPVTPITLKSRVKRAFQFYDRQYRLV